MLSASSTQELKWDRRATVARHEGRLPAPVGNRDRVRPGSRGFPRRCHRRMRLPAGGGDETGGVPERAPPGTPAVRPRDRSGGARQAGRGGAALRPGHRPPPARAARRGPHPGPVPGLRRPLRTGPTGAGEARPPRRQGALPGPEHPRRRDRADRRGREAPRAAGGGCQAHRLPPDAGGEGEGGRHAPPDAERVLPGVVRPALRRRSLGAGDGGGRGRREPPLGEGRSVTGRDASCRSEMRIPR